MATPQTHFFFFNSFFFKNKIAPSATVSKHTPSFWEREGKSKRKPLVTIQGTQNRGRERGDVGNRLRSQWDRKMYFPQMKLARCSRDPAMYPQGPVIVRSFKGYCLGTPTRIPQLFCTVCVCLCVCVHVHACMPLKVRNHPRISQDYLPQRGDIF